MFIFLSVKAFAIDVNIDGKYIEFDTQQPIIENGRTLVPMRKIFEELGCEVEWLNKTQTIVATKNSKLIVLQINNQMMFVEDIESKQYQTIELEVSPKLLNNRTLMPIRAISEVLDYTVSWDEENKTVAIKNK